MSTFSVRPILAIAGTALALAAAVPAVAARLSFPVAVEDNNTCASMGGTWQTRGDIGNPVLTCVIGAVGGAPTCSITQSQSVSPNTSVSLMLTACTVAGAVTQPTITWNQGAVAGPQVGVAATYTTPLLTATTTYYATATANGLSNTYSTTVTVNGVQPAPGGGGSCANYSASYLGELPFDGVRYVTEGVTGNTVFYARITVPNPLPAGWSGRTPDITAYSYVDGDHYMKAYLSRNPCEFGASGGAFNQGTSIHLYPIFETESPFNVTMRAGDVWYLNIKHEKLGGGPSCSAGQSCNFAVRAQAM